MQKIYRVEIIGDKGVPNIVNLYFNEIFEIFPELMNYFLVLEKIVLLPDFLSVTIKTKETEFTITYDN